MAHRAPRKSAGSATAEHKDASNAGHSSSSTHANGHSSPLPAAHPSDVPRTTAQEINPFPSGKDPSAVPPSTAAAAAPATDESVYGSSYTNRRTREFDLLHDIVRQTRSAFIDVSQKPVAIDEEDMTERSTLYSKHLQALQAQPTTAAAVPAAALLTSTLLGGATLPSLFALPIGAVGGSGELAGTREVTAEEREWMVAAAREMTAAIEGTRLKDVGKIVRTFEEL